MNEGNLKDLQSRHTLEEATLREKLAKEQKQQSLLGEDREACMKLAYAPGTVCLYWIRNVRRDVPWTEIGEWMDDDLFCPGGRKFPEDKIEITNGLNHGRVCQIVKATDLYVDSRFLGSGAAPWDNTFHPLLTRYVVRFLAQPSPYSDLSAFVNRENEQEEVNVTDCFLISHDEAKEMGGVMGVQYDLNPIWHMQCPRKPSRDFVRKANYQPAYPESWLSGDYYSPTSCGF